MDPTINWKRQEILSSHKLMAGAFQLEYTTLKVLVTKKGKEHANENPIKNQSSTSSSGNSITGWGLGGTNCSGGIRGVDGVDWGIIRGPGL